jgi:hypothetical protein
MKKLLLLFTLITFLAGCLPVDSLEPLYTDKDTVFDTALLGEWVSPDANDDGVTTFTEVSGHPVSSYTIMMQDKDKNGATSYSAHLVDLQGHRFLDVVPENWDARANSYALHLDHSKNGVSLQPRLLRLGPAAYMEFTSGGQSPKGEQIQARLRTAHWFFKVTTEGKKLRLDWVDDDKFQKEVIKATFRLENTLLGDGKDKDVVITASTRELQKFVVEHVNDDKLFSEHSTEIQRRK